MISIEPQFLSPTFTRSNEEEGELANIRVPLTMTLCDRGKNPDGCGLLQLREEVEPDLLYRRYFYRSATSDTMRNDLRDVVEDISSRIELKPQDIVVDIGANDCTTLAFYPVTCAASASSPRATSTGRRSIAASPSSMTTFLPAVRAAFSRRKGQGGRLQRDVLRLSDPNSFVADVKAILASDGIGASSSAICR